RGWFQQWPAFYRRLLHEAIERIRGFRPSRVVDFPILRRAGVFAVSGLLALLLVWSIFTDRVPTTLARIFLPFADIPPASGVLYAVAPGDAKVLHGDDVAFSVRVEKGE